MAEDRFANVFNGTVTMSAPDTLTFAELVFGITLRDRIAIVIDELFYWVGIPVLTEMTAVADALSFGITTSDQVTNLNNPSDRRIINLERISRSDFGTAAGGQFVRQPFHRPFSPPIILLPNRIFFGMASAGLASAATGYVRIHFRTVSITQDQQLIEVLETFQLSS